LAKFNGANTVTNGPALGSDTTKFLRNDGTWQVPSYPTVNNATLTIQKNGTTVKTFTANASSDVTANITVPTTAADVNAIATSAKGAANGVAELDANGLVPASQLPSYVDDVLEYANKSSFPTTGETGKIYVALDTNLTYRWGGSNYVEISPSLALGETSSTAYRGDRGKIAYDHSQVTGNPHGTSAATSTTGISISDHSTGSIYGVKSTTTTASKVTLGTAISVPNVTSAGSGDFTSGAFFGGSGSFTATVTNGVLSFSHTHVAATHDPDTHTHIAPTLGTEISIPNVTSVANVTVPIKNDSATTVVTGKTHTVTDNGHTHTLS